MQNSNDFPHWLSEQQGKGALPDGIICVPVRNLLDSPDSILHQVFKFASSQPGYVAMMRKLVEGADEAVRDDVRNLFIALNASADLIAAIFES